MNNGEAVFDISYTDPDTLDSWRVGTVYADNAESAMSKFLSGHRSFEGDSDCLSVCQVI